MSQIHKVIEILSDCKIVINAGSNQNIHNGEKFLIYSLSDKEIIDPDTNESLGYLEIVKGTGVVTHVQEKMSTLESNTYHYSSKTIKRTSPFHTVFNPSIEEVETDKTQEPFTDPSIGDLAKRVN